MHSARHSDVPGGDRDRDRVVSVSNGGGGASSGITPTALRGYVQRVREDGVGREFLALSAAAAASAQSSPEPCLSPQNAS